MVGDIVRHPQKWGSDVANHVTVALEDRISALTTKDPNKIRIYTQGLDGHCLRAYTYWSGLMPDIRQQMLAIEQAVEVVKVTYDDGSVEYLPKGSV